MLCRYNHLKPNSARADKRNCHKNFTQRSVRGAYHSDKIYSVTTKQDLRNVWGNEAMAFTPQKNTVSMSELESRYNEITSLYDLASELAETVDSRLTANPGEQWAAIEPLVNEVGDVADILSEEFLHVAESVRSRTPGKASKARIEGSLRRLYGALHEYRERVRNVAKQAYSAIENIADPVVEKIQRQAERIVVIFLEFIRLSLSSIMNHAELSQLRAREARVALMMHQAAQNSNL